MGSDLDLDVASKIGSERVRGRCLGEGRPATDKGGLRHSIHSRWSSTELYTQLNGE